MKPQIQCFLSCITLLLHLFTSRGLSQEKILLTDPLREPSSEVCGAA